MSFQHLFPANLNFLLKTIDDNFNQNDLKHGIKIV